MRLDASDIQFSEMKSDEQTTAGENTVRVGGEWRRWGGEGSGGGGEGKESEGGGGATPSFKKINLAKLATMTRFLHESS